MPRTNAIPLFQYPVVVGRLPSVFWGLQKKVRHLLGQARFFTSTTCVEAPVVIGVGGEGDPVGFEKTAEEAACVVRVEVFEKGALAVGGERVEGDA